MKRITIIFIFLLVSVFSTSSFLLYLGFIQNYKRDFKEHILKYKTQTPLTVIHINPSELYTNSSSVSWKDDNQEILYNNVLYDIISIKNNGIKVAITMVSDEQEMELEKEFSNVYDIHSNHSAKGPFQLLKGFFALKYLAGDSFTELATILTNQPHSHRQKMFLITEIVIHTEVPPPDFFS